VTSDARAFALDPFNTHFSLIACMALGRQVQIFERFEMVRLLPRTELGLWQFPHASGPSTFAGSIAAMSLPL
jgi:hypothetical protein